MYWFPYVILVINLLIIWLMPKNLTKKEIYISWFVIALINLSTDVVFSFYYKLYELAGPGVQLPVHIIELTLGASFGIIFLNFMPEKIRPYFLYVAVWIVVSMIFELMFVKVHFLNYFTWKPWYSPPYYLAALLYMRWHLWFIRKPDS